jgi:hypothetical protein
MATNDRLKSRIIKVVVVVLICIPIMFLSVTSVKYWWRVKEMQMYHIPVAIQDTGNIVNFYHEGRHTNGDWPAPGSIQGRGAWFIGSYDDRGTRVDVYNYHGSHYVRFELRGHSVEVHVTRDPPAQLSAAVP